MKTTRFNRYYFGRLQALLLAITLLAISVPFIPGQPASAAGFGVTVRVDSLVAGNTNTNGRLCFISDQTATPIKSVRITFPFTNAATDYQIGATGTWATSTTNLDTQPVTQNAMTGLGTNASAISNAAHTVVFDDSAGFTPANTTNTYCFNWTSTAGGLTMPTVWTGNETTPGKVEMFSAIGAGGSILSSAQFAEPKTVATNGTNINVSAIVPPSFSYTLGATADTFNTATISTLNYTAGVTGTVITNASSGWIIWARSSANAGGCSQACMHSTLKGYDIKSSAAPGSAAAVITNAAEHYDFQVSSVSLNAGTGTCTAVTPSTYYNGTVTSTQGGPLDKTVMYPVASCDGSSSNASVVMKEILVPIASTPAAADYTDTIFTTAAGRF